ncbi:hypothetical protein SNE40_017068 [Patella caerulea]|uniref:Secreted protein n=1 Tax=Patella caerulea TaxID=87958 RepID=A0AAN8J9P9_PATCE
MVLLQVVLFILTTAASGNRCKSKLTEDATKLQTILDRKINSLGVDASYFNTNLGEIFLNTEGSPGFCEFKTLGQEYLKFLSSENNTDTGVIIWVMQEFSNRFHPQKYIPLCQRPNFTETYSNEPVLVKLSRNGCLRYELCFQKLPIFCHKVVTESKDATPKGKMAEDFTTVKNDNKIDFT